MNPITKFAIDLLEGAVFGAAVALLALPDGFTDGRAAIYVVAGGVIGGVKAAARIAVTTYVASRNASP